MSISTELSRLSSAKSALASAIEAKGVTVPDGTTLDGYGDLVTSIETGSSDISSGVSWDTFDGSGNLTAATVYGLKVIDYEFYNQTHLTSVSMSNVTSIGLDGFYTCSSLALTSLPSGLTTVGAYGFYFCTGLLLTSLPSTVVTLSNYAFYNCTGLTLTTLPPSLTILGTGVFYNCTGLTTMTLPSGLVSMNTTAFRRCTSLTKIWIPSTCTTITAINTTSSPFYECSSGLTVYCAAASKPAGWGSYWNYYATGSQLTVVWNTTLEQFNAL